MPYTLQHYNGKNPGSANIYKEIEHLTASVVNLYPQHKKWYHEKFLPELKQGTRRIIAAYITTGELVGIALLKDTPTEKKICTLFVTEGHRYHHIAHQLIEKSMELLQTKKPKISVSEKALSSLKPLLDNYGFELTTTVPNAYLKGITEYYFNGLP